MRRISHISLRYLVDRLTLLVHEMRHPDEPWIAPQAVRALETLVLASDKGYEFGSGRSTLWLASRMAHLTSIEDNPLWAEKMQRSLANRRIENVEYLFVGEQENQASGADSYVEAMRKCQDGSLDFVMIDGNFRGLCTGVSLQKLKPGGILVIDNVERYLPSGSRAPNARGPQEGPLEQDGWTRIWDTVGHWRMIWVTSGVSDTAIFFKPHLI